MVNVLDALIILTTLIATVSNAFVQLHPNLQRNGQHRELRAKSGNDGNNKNNKNGSNSWSTRDKERRAEEKRKQDRANEVVIGKTSAVPEAQDYALDVAATEQEWLRQASDVEQAVFRLTDEGMDHLKLLKIEKAAQTFDRVFELKPKAYLWQAGIARYYLGDFTEAADIFARCARIYETRFGEPASEERIWRNACELKIQSATKRRTTAIEAIASLPKLPFTDRTDELLASETRKVLRISQQLFRATVEQNDVRSVVSRAKLRSIGGTSNTPDLKQWKLNSWFYLGLFYDVTGNGVESKNCMKRALRLSSPNGNDLIHTLPMMHMSQRDWFDDDEVGDDNEEFSTAEAHPVTLTETSKKAVSRYVQEFDPVFLASFEDGLNEMKLYELKEALRIRGMTTTGSKAEVVERLFVAVLTDTGFIFQ